MNNKSSFHPRAVITDIDGTITNKERRLNLDSVSVIRTLVDNGIPVVLASGNTECSLTFLCKMIGTDGTIIAENGGLYKITYAGERKICSDRAACLEAYEKIREYYDEKGIELQLYSPEYRFADVAFARTVDPAEVREIVSGMPVKILDSGFAIHIQSGDINKVRQRQCAFGRGLAVRSAKGFPRCRSAERSAPETPVDLSGTPRQSVRPAEAVRVV